MHTLMESQNILLENSDTTLSHTVYLALGSNLGDREANLQAAISRLRAGGHIQVCQLSAVYETAPWGYTDQPDFLNMALLARTDFSPAELLSYLKEVEVEMGRAVAFLNAPRPIDLDIIFYDDLVFESDTLAIPHPRLRGRGFVLAPLADLAPNYIHPGLNLAVKDLLTEINLAEAGVRFFPGGDVLHVPPPHFLFVTGRLAEDWLRNYLSELAGALGFNFTIATLNIDVAAFITCRFVADKLMLTSSDRQQLDLLVLPGFAGGDLALVENSLKVRAVRGPTEISELEAFLVNLIKGCNYPAFAEKAGFYSEDQLRQMQARLTDSNIRIYTDGQRIFAFNNEFFGCAEPDERGLRTLFRQLKIDNAAHAYYIGREFHKAAVAVKLGKLYRQDRELEF